MTDPNAPTQDHPDEQTSDKGGDSDPSTKEGFAPPDADDAPATGEAQAEENRDRESPS
jgi:hypothetical protein